MIDLGIVLPGETIYIPFDSYDGATGASEAISGLAVGDIRIYKNGGTTERASTTGYTLLDTDGIDFDSVVGLNGFSIDLSSNATADFFTAGARYWVVISSITADAQTVNFTAATFKIGHPQAILNTTIATLASQTSFTLTAGSADNSAYVGCVAYIHDIASAVQCCMGVISAYTGSTKTVTLAADPGIFTMAAGDNIMILPRVNVYSIGGTAQTGRDNGTGNLPADVQTIKTQTVTCAAGVTVLANVGTAATSTAQTGDAFARLGAPAGASVSADIAAVKVDTAATLADTGTDGVVVAAASKTGYALSAAGVQAIWDALTSALTTVGSIGKKLADWTIGTAQTGDAFARLGAPTGASVSADIAAVKAETAAIVADTNELQGDWTNGGRLDLILDARASQSSVDTVDTNVDSILADTNELQTDWTDGGRLDLILDAINQRTQDIAVSGSAVSAIAESVTVSAGTETGTFQNTQLHNGTYHQVTAAAGSIDYYYEFNIGVDGVPVKVSIVGRLDEGSAPGGGDTVDVYAWDWVGSAWDHISPTSGDFVGIFGSSTSDDASMVMTLIMRHVGTGANDGKVRIRLAGATLEANTALYIDAIYVEWTNPLAITGIVAAIEAGELAKVPKSDGTVVHNATAIAAIQSGLSTHSAADVKTAMEANGAKLDHLWEMTEDDAGTRRLTANALEQSPTGTGGFTSNDRTILENLQSLL